MMSGKNMKTKVKIVRGVRHACVMGKTIYPGIVKCYGCEKIVKIKI